jgi:hypothetical protein
MHRLAEDPDTDVGGGQVCGERQPLGSGNIRCRAHESFSVWLEDDWIARTAASMFSRAILTGPLSRRQLF